MLPDDDKQYAIETCRGSESVLKKLFKNKWHTISSFVGCVIISESELQILVLKIPQKYFIVGATKKVTLSSSLSILCTFYELPVQFNPTSLH